MQGTRLVLGAAFGALLAGCASTSSTDRFVGLVTPYRIDIVQGNVVTREQAALLRPGMSRTQVRDILGSPMIADVFHAGRWDYVFTIRRQGTEPQRRSVTVHFDGELVKAVDATELPTEQEFVASIARPLRVRAGPLELTEAQRKALPLPPPRAVETPPEPEGAVRSYPPLEPT